MDRPMAPAAYVAGDGLEGHQWKKKPWILPRVDPPPSVGECQGREMGRGRLLERGNTLIEEGGGRWDRGLMDRKPRKGITFEM